MPVQTVQPSLGSHAIYHPRMAMVREALKNVKTQDLAMRTSLLRRTYLTSRVGTGLITFAPSAMIDLAHSIYQDTNGKLHFDSRHFALASARSQSGNLIGFTAGAIAISAVSSITAPVILGSFVLGVFMQIVWGISGGPDYAEETMGKMLGY